MYPCNGVVYGGEPKEPIKVMDVKILPNRILLITFNNNEQRVFDTELLVGKVYEPLAEESVYRDLRIDHGVVTWLDGDIDCAPEYMYEHSTAYPTDREMYLEAGVA